MQCPELYNTTVSCIYTDILIEIFILRWQGECQAGMRCVGLDAGCGRAFGGGELAGAGAGSPASLEGQPTHGHVGATS